MFQVLATKSWTAKLKKTKVEHKERVSEFPTSPGVYLMKNNSGKVIYVGKAKDLRARVSSYFQEGRHISAKTVHLVRQIHHIDYIITQTEVEAYLLEASLIKKHRPKYNIRLKDDKSYPYIRCSMKDKYPRFYLHRRVESDGSVYFGPYTSGLAVRETIRFLNRTFRIRDCSDGFFKTRKRPCMTYQIGRCTAPCVELIEPKLYLRDVSSALDFLKGRDKDVIKELKRRMKDASHEERFEYAAKLRDSIDAISSILKKQVVVSSDESVDQDVVAYFGDPRGTLVEVLHIRKGRVIGNRYQFIPELDPSSEDEDPKEWLTSFLNQYYTDNIIPERILLPHDLTQDIYKLLADVFFERQKIKSVFVHALGRDGQKLMDMAKENAKNHFNDYINKQTNTLAHLGEIQAKLRLPRLPVRIECFDISNFQGEESVGSQVVFEHGVPKRDDYRRYKIRTVKGSNDFQSMLEVLTRRLKHTEYDDPHLIVIDGGKGQLNMALRALKEIGRTDIPVVGMAKARTEGEFTDQEVTSSEERFFLPGQTNPVVFKQGSMALNILVQLRDEAHRFAITYHRKLRDQRILTSELDAVQGLGEKRKLTLLKHFGSVDAIRMANVDEISTLSGFSKKLAEAVLTALNNNV
jgi:excinuclease ABC subunit C